MRRLIFDSFPRGQTRFVLVLLSAVMLCAVTAWGQQ